MSASTYRQHYLDALPAEDNLDTTTTDNQPLFAESATASIVIAILLAISAAAAFGAPTP